MYKLIPTKRCVNAQLYETEDCYILRFYNGAEWTLKQFMKTDAKDIGAAHYEFEKIKTREQIIQANVRY